MYSYQIGSVNVHATAHHIMLQLIEEINSQSEIPVIYNPDQSYEQVVEHYRTEIAERYNEQLKEDEIIPALIGWRRDPLRWPEGFGEKSGASRTYSNEYGIDRKLTGRQLDVTFTKVDLPLYFRIYSSDVRLLDAFEVGYLTKTLISNINLITAEMVEINQVEQYSVKWNFGEGSFESTQDDASYSVIEFSCIVTGNVAVSQATPVGTADPKIGLGSDGIYKPIKLIGERFEVKPRVDDVAFPNRDPKSNTFDPYVMVDNKDAWRTAMRDKFKHNKV